jgi:hypothetical protein
MMAGLSLLLTNGLVLLSTVQALADAEEKNPAAATVFESASKEARADLPANGTSYTVSVNRKLVYSTSPPVKRLHLGRVFISNDGQTIAWLLDDRFDGNINPLPGIIDQIALNSPALICFHKGKLIKSYSLADLLVRTRLLSVSVSHTEWISEKRDGNWKFSPTVNFASDGSRLEFETTSMRRYVFNPQTGQILSGEDTNIWKEADVIAYGEIVGDSGKLHLKRPKFLKGQLENPEETTIIDPSGSYSPGSHAIALRKIFGCWTTCAPEYAIPTNYNLLP